MYTIKPAISKPSRCMWTAVGTVSLTIAFVLVMSSYNYVMPNIDERTIDAASVFQHKLDLTQAARTFESFYGIMFDAGSTGSRIHIFKFKQNAQNIIELENEVFRQVKPGLSHYSHEPKKGAYSLTGMLNAAKKYIPSSQWSKTPIALKATAGLRLLPEGAADNLLNEVRSLFHQYPFKVKDNSVTIMDGADEGVFSWFTVNFLIQTVNNPLNTTGTLDLGGGSTQVTFVPHSQETLLKAPTGYIENVSLSGRNYTLYTHSYLGNGLMSARFQLYGGKEDKSETSSVSNKLSSSCLPAGYSGKWTHGGTDYVVEGVTSANSRYEECYKLSNKLVKNIINSPLEIKTKNRIFYAFSYYYDRAVDVNLINKETGGQVKVQQFLTAAKTVCNSKSLDTPHLDTPHLDTPHLDTPHLDTPHLCTDLAYISALLHEGLEFDLDTSLLLMKKINGVETSWALGAMFQIMDLHD